MEVAVGDERTHAKLGGQGEGVAVAAFSRFDIGMVWPSDNLAKQAEAPRLVATLLVSLGEGHGLPGLLQSIVEAPFEQVCLTEPRELHGPPHTHRAHRRCVLYHVFEKVPPLVGSPGERARVSQSGENCPGSEVPLTSEGARALQDIDGLIEITQSEGHATHAGQGLGQRVWVVCAFRDPERVLRMRARLSESPQIRESQGEPAV